MAGGEPSKCFLRFRELAPIEKSSILIKTAATGTGRSVLSRLRDSLTIPAKKKENIHG